MRREIRELRTRVSALVAVIGIALAVMLTLARAEAQEGRGQGEGVETFAGGQMVRGTVTAATADRLTVKTDGGEVYQVSVSVNTRIRRERQPIKLADVKTGEAIGAVGVMDATTKTVHAVFVTVVDAEQARKMKEGLGKVYIAGKIMAIDEVKLTVLRPDGVSQVIEVDESTSFKRGGRGMASVLNGSGPIGEAGIQAPAGGQGSGGESITLLDVKVGNTIAGRGGIKNGFFVPTELGVMDAAAIGQRRRRSVEGAASSAGVTPAATPPASAAPAPK